MKKKSKPGINPNEAQSNQSIPNAKSNDLTNPSGESLNNPSNQQVPKAPSSRHSVQQNTMNGSKMNMNYPIKMKNIEDEDRINVNQ